MKVEKYTDEDHRTIVENQKAEVEASGGVWEDPADRLKREEEEADAAAEAQRKEELKAKCAKKGLNFEEEEAKYQAVQEAKRKAAEEKAAAKKKAAEEKAEAKRKAAEEKENNKKK